jgi:hypothetical protein
MTVVRGCWRRWARDTWSQHAHEGRRQRQTGRFLTRAPASRSAEERYYPDTSLSSTASKSETYHGERAEGPRQRTSLYISA